MARTAKQQAALKKAQAVSAARRKSDAAYKRDLAANGFSEAEDRTNQARRDAWNASVRKAYAGKTIPSNVRKALGM